MQIRYNLASTVDIQRLYNDKEYAEEKGIIVKQQKSERVKNLENMLREVDNEDEQWREKVMSLKAEITDAKKSENNIYLLKYNKNNLNITNQKTLGLFRSVILHNDKIISFSPPKSIDNETFLADAWDIKTQYEIQEFIEGTMINMFFNTLTQEWEIASRSSVGARCSFYQDKKITFRTMFLEAMNRLGYEFADFNKNLCYSWILQHPDNRIVVPFTQSNIILCKVYQCQDLVVNEISLTDWDENIFVATVPYEIPRSLNKVIDCEGLDFNEIRDKFYTQNMDYRIMGGGLYKS